MHLISFYLGTTIHVRHLPRISTASAVLADALTRVSTTTPEIRAQIRGTMSGTVPDALLAWLDDPVDDWTLAMQLLKSVQEKVVL